MKKIRLLICLLAFLALACVLLPSPAIVTNDPEAQRATEDYQLTSTANAISRQLTADAPVVISPTPSSTPSPTPDSVTCGYSWAYQDNPELTTVLQEALQETGLTPALVSAYSFGENCVHPDGSSGGFGAMETDYRIRFEDAIIPDPAARGTAVETVIRAIEQLPVDLIKGPNPGVVEIEWTAVEGRELIRFYLRDGKQALVDGLSGNALLEKLSNP